MGRAGCLRLFALLAVLVLMPVAAGPMRRMAPAMPSPLCEFSAEFRPVPPGSGLSDRTLEHVDLHALALSVDDRHR